MDALTRYTTVRFTLRPTAAQERALWRHVGAARFGFNQALQLVNEAVAARRADPEVRVPWTGFDLINAFNRWKCSPAAGVDERGAAGLAWRKEVAQQVFEEAVVDLARGLRSYASRGTSGRAAGFPKFKKRSRSQQSFRLRNQRRGERTTIEIGAGEQRRSIRLPKLGILAVRECTRKLRRMLSKGRATLLFATVSHQGGGRWSVSLNLRAAPLDPALRTADAASRPVGVDRGLQTFAVLADTTGREIERIDAPRPLRTSSRKLRKLSHSLTRKQLGSRNRSRARVRLARLHHRVANVRRAFVHRTSSRLAKTHGHLVLETLSAAGLMRTRLARSVADNAWAMFARALAYKLAWRGGTLTLADRYYPSTRRCSACGETGDVVPLWRRMFRCSRCGHEADRDTNAAACLAQYPEVQWPPVAAKRAETRNVCREESAGAWGRSTRETVLVEAERAPARRPRRAA